MYVNQEERDIVIRPVGFLRMLFLYMRTVVAQGTVWKYKIKALKGQVEKLESQAGGGDPA